MPLIDPETSRTQVVSHRDGREHILVMSDEYNSNDRSFAAGHDLIFEAVEKPDDSNQAIQFYNSSRQYVTTENGSLVLITRAVKTKWVEWNDGIRPYVQTKNYTSAMVQSWNKFCFTGGILEMSIQLPGKAYSGGIWPAAWLMGQLSRATFQDTTTNIWPWSYNKCGHIDHIETRQKFSACESNPGYGFHPYQGRGAPEIDIFEIMPGHEMPDMTSHKKEKKYVPPFMSTSLQIAPGIAKGPKRPINGQLLNTSQTWYDDLKISSLSEYNYGFWGQECGPEIDPSPKLIHKYMEDAVSVNTFLNETHFDKHHIYRLEWQPGSNGYLEWYLDDELIFGIEGTSLEKVTGSLIPQEPMYLILNTAISHRWGMPEPCDINTCSMCWRCYDCTNPDCQCTLPEGMKNCKNLPAKMSIDYIRLYQDPLDSTHTIGCSPPQYPTEGYIQAHIDKFSNWKPYSGILAEDIMLSERYSSMIDTGIQLLGILVLGVFLVTLFHRLYRLYMSRYETRYAISGLDNYHHTYQSIPHSDQENPSSTATGTGTTGYREDNRSRGNSDGNIYTTSSSASTYNRQFYDNRNTEYNSNTGYQSTNTSQSYLGNNSDTSNKSSTFRVQ